MNDDETTSARADIEQRVAKFRRHQAALRRAREGYYDDVIAQVRATDWNEFATSRAVRKPA